MREKTKSDVRKIIIGACLGAIIVLAVLLFLGSTVPLRQPLEEEVEEVVEEVPEEIFEEEITGEVISEVEEEIVEEELSTEEVEEEEEEPVTELGNYVLSQKDCKCYSADGDVPEGNLYCEGVFGLVGCSEAGIPIKGYMLDSDGNIKEEYRERLGLA